MLLICTKTLIQASLVHVLTQYSKHVGSLVNQTVFRERACASERGRGGGKILSLAQRSLNAVWFTRLACGQTCTLYSLKVGVTHSLRMRQMLKVDLCTNGTGPCAPYAPPLPTGLHKHAQNSCKYTNSFQVHTFLYV